MAPEIRRINHFMGKKGLLVKKDGSKKIEVQGKIEISENGEFVYSPDGSSVELARKWVDVHFSHPLNISVYADLLADTNSVELYSLTAVGHLNGDDLLVARVSDIYLIPPNRGNGRDVSYTKG